MTAPSIEPLDLVRLDDRGRAYFADQLSLDTVFCRTLAESLNLAEGDCFAMLPRRLETERAYQFDQGNLLKENAAHPIPPRGGLIPVKTLIDRQARRIHEFLQSSPSALCIIDDAVAQKSDPASASLATTVFIDKEVIYRLDRNATLDDIKSALSRSNHIWHGLAALCLPSSPIDRQALSDMSVLGQCLSSVRELQAVAYDGEGFLSWHVRDTSARSHDLA